MTGRYDASSKFVKDNRWGFFPGMSAGWIISEEEFMKDMHWLDYLKADLVMVLQEIMESELMMLLENIQLPINTMAMLL